MALLEKGPPSINQHDAPNINEFDNMVELGEENNDGRGNNQKTQAEDTPTDWMALARDAMQYSTGYLDANYRKKWEDGIRAFNNQHPLDSKYNNPAYSKRSNLYRPKIRAAIRKNEAAAAAAFFSNMDVVNVGAVQQSDPAQRASAEVMKELLQYRLMTPDPTVGINWFLMLEGALQDAQTVGVCVTRQYWDYTLRNGKKTDKPCIKLIPVENIRIDPSADWFDPINSSPYVIELMPMFVGEVKNLMADGTWKEYSEGDIQSAQAQKSDSTRMVRNKDRTDPADTSGQSISDYDVVWIERHIHRKDGDDYVFYRMGEIGLLTEPVPLSDEVFHGERDYVMGIAVIETHKVMPSGLPEMSRGLADEVNEVTNQRLDNVKFVLNKRWFVKRGKNTDTSSLVRNVPGGITMTDDPEMDIKEVNWPDVTQSSFEEHNRLNAEFSDLLGDFSPQNAQLARGAKEPAKVMQMMSQSGTPLVEYLMRTFTVTWVEPVLRQLVKLEQKYETDQTILAIAADRAKLVQKYGINQVTDELLNKDLTLTVNVGMGATDPMAKLQKFSQGLLTLGQIVAAKIPGLNYQEISKEQFALMGYQDGKRFMAEDPNVTQMKQALQMKDQAIQELTKRLNDKQNDNVTKLRIAQHKDDTQIAKAVIQHGHENRHKLADIIHSTLQTADDRSFQMAQQANEPKDAA